MAKINLDNEINLFYKLQQEKKEIENRLKSLKETIMTEMTRLENDYYVNTNNIKASKYTQVRLSIEGKFEKNIVKYLYRRKLFDLIKLKINTKELENKFEKGELEEEDFKYIKSYLNNEVTECFRVQQVRENKEEV